MTNRIKELREKQAKLVSEARERLDQIGVDGIFNGLSAAADSAGSALRRLQTGRVQQYAAGFVAGAVILVVLFVFVL